MTDISKLENDIVLLNAARYSEGPNKGKRLVEVDRPYARDVFAKQTQLAELKKAENLKVHISADQLAGLGSQYYHPESHNRGDIQKLQRAMAVKNPQTGKRLVEEKPALRVEIEQAMSNVFGDERFTMSPELTAIVGAK